MFRLGNGEQASEHPHETLDSFTGGDELSELVGFQPHSDALREEHRPYYEHKVRAPHNRRYAVALGRGWQCMVNDHPDAFKSPVSHEPLVASHRRSIFM